MRVSVIEDYVFEVHVKTSKQSLKHKNLLEGHPDVKLVDTGC